MTINVELEDGTIIEDVPEGITQKELTRRLSKMRGKDKQPNPLLEAITRPVRLVSQTNPIDAIKQLPGLGVGFLSGVGNRFGGVAQTVLDATSEAPFLPEGLRKSASEFSNSLGFTIGEAERMEEERFGPSVGAGREIGKVATDIGILSRIPGLRNVRGPSVTNKLTGTAGVVPLLKRTLQAGGIGGFVGGTQLQKPGEERSRAEDALVTGAISSGIPFGVRAGQRIFDAFRPSRVLARQLKVEEALKTPEAIKSQRELSEIGIRGAKAKLSQLTGNEKILKAEAEAVAANPEIAKLDNNFIKGNLRKFVGKVLDRIDPKRSGARQTASLVKKEIDQQRKFIDKISQKFFKVRFEKAIRITKDSAVVDTSHAKNILLKDRNDILKMAAGEEKKAALSAVNHWLQRVRPGNLSIRHTQQFLRESGSKIKQSPKFETQIQQAQKGRFDKMVFGSLNQSLKNSAKTNEGAKLLLRARSGLKASKDRLKSINDTGLVQILDNPKRVKTKQVLDFFSNPSTTSDDINIVMPLLREETRGAVQRQFIQRLSNKSRLSETASKGTDRLDFNKAAENLKIDDRFNAIFPNKIVRNEFIKVKSALRILAQKGGPVQTQSITSSVTEFARNIVSQSAIFIAGLVARRMTPSMLNKLLQTRNGRMSIINAAKIIKNPKTVPPSVIVLTARTLKESQERK
jgi:hypothetical protein